ncbi:MAG TPA: SCO family protein [Polyangiaceae bacterium]|nr:SCO family protein [Polyangiaceae bacterium]
MRLAFWLLALLGGLWARPAMAQAALPLENLPLPPKNVGFDQNIGRDVPLAARFKDETGKSVALGDYFGKKPVLLSFAYFTCPMLCGLSMQGLSSSLKGMNLDAGRDFEVLTVSFEPRETPEMARAKKEMAMARYGRPEAAAGWHFLTGDASAIESLATAAGFRYEWDAETKQYAHATGLVVLTPEGNIARYLFGVEYAPRDVRFALVEASQGKVGSIVDQLLLLCYHYDPKTGRYGAIAINTMRAGGVLTLLAFGAFVIVSARSERKSKRKTPLPLGGAE